MFLKLRIFFTILSALCLAALIPVAVWAGWTWFFIVGGGAFLFFMLMLLCKQSQEKGEEEQNDTAKTDFFHPKK